MPLALFIASIVLIVSGVRGKSAQLLSLLYGDFTGPNNFVYWFLAISIIGAIGYVDDLRDVSRSLLVLILIVLILHENKNRNLFQAFTDAVGNATATPAHADASIGFGGSSGGAGVTGTY